MKSVHVVSLKKFYVHDDSLYTYGGFPAYLEMLSEHFDKIFLIVPVTKQQFDNPIQLNNNKYVIRPLPCYWNELQLILLSPIIFILVGYYLFNSQLVNPRIPDFTGLIGLFFSKLYFKPHFVSIQSDLKELLHNQHFTGLKGFSRNVLYFWLRFNLALERLLCANSVCLPQGQLLFDRFSKFSKSYLWISTAIKSDFISKNSPFHLFNSKQIRILNIGRYCIQKNQQLCIYSALNLSSISTSSDIYLLISGKRDTKIYPSLKSFSENINNSNSRIHIDVLPPIAGNPYGLISTYDSFHFFLLTSLWEGTPKVIIEAMARGLIVIAPNLGGLQNTIINNFNGFTFSDFSSHSISQLLLKITSTDPHELLRISLNAIDSSSNYTVDAQKLVLKKAIVNCQ